jgi:two-component system, NtrC family, response regulator AlgB
LKLRTKRRNAETSQDAVEDSLLMRPRSPDMRRLLENAEQAAVTNGTILLTGESGTGKTLLARQIHLWSSRRTKPFVTIDCTMFSRQSLEKERAGWTLDALPIGAKRASERFEAAEGGTLFLASIDDLPPALQVEFAQFVQDRTLKTTEGEKTIDVRLIAASNRDLVPEVRAHRFREDLFYNLNIISLRVPALRERPTDILPLALGMLVTATIRNRRGNLNLSPEAAAVMTRYRWPGNVRELRNAMEAAAVLCEGETITLANLPEAVAKNALGTITSTSSKTSLDEIERQHILRVLAESPTLEQAAATLGINVATLYRKRKRLNLVVAIGSRHR